MMSHILLILQQINIEEKIQNAPDSGYQIGIVIGTYLPFVLLAILAYWAYHRAKNRKDLDD